jgi:hypothetical protein
MTVNPAIHHATSNLRWHQWQVRAVRRTGVARLL